MDQRFRWVGMLAAVLFSVMVGVVSYNAGVLHGLALPASGAGAAPGTVAPLYWYHPWGFGFGFFPFGFVLFWFLLFRFVWWGGYHRRRSYYRGLHDVPASFDEWHRRAHEHMTGAPPAQGQGTHGTA